MVDSLFVGETDNIGNPVTPEEMAYGRSLPKRLIPDFPIRGYEYYDYRHDVVNTTFVNFQDNKQRGSGALSWLLFTGAGVTTENTVKGAKFVNAKPVYFPKIDPRFDNDNRGGVGLPDRWRSTIWTARRPASLIPMSCSTTARTTASPRTTPARFIPPGTPLCARVISDAFSSASGGPDPQGVLVLR